MSKDDEYWHSIMVALSEEFINVGREAKDQKAGETWVAAGREVRKTADQAMETAGVAEKLVTGGST